MSLVRHFEEHDFYSSSEETEDFAKYLSSSEENDNDGEEECVSGSDLEDCTSENELKDTERIDNINEKSSSNQENGDATALVDSLLDNLLSGAFSDSSDSKIADERYLEVEDCDKEEEEVDIVNDENTYKAEGDDKKCIEEVYIEMKSDEEQVSMDDIPDFASKRNVYGTCFNVSTGVVIRPHRTHDTSTSMTEVLKNRKTSSCLNYGAKIDTACRFTNVFTKTADEVVKMETRDFQIIIRDAFNSKRLAVILLGVDKDNKITGCCMPMRDQDNLCLALDTAFQTEFVPKVENVLDVADINFIRVNNSENNDKFLVVIRIKQLRNQIYELESDSTFSFTE